MRVNGFTRESSWVVVSSPRDPTEASEFVNKVNTSSKAWGSRPASYLLGSQSSHSFHGDVSCCVSTSELLNSNSTIVVHRLPCPGLSARQTAWKPPGAWSATRLTMRLASVWADVMVEQQKIGKQ